MDPEQRTFLEELLATETPAGFETAGQQRWIEYVGRFADEVRTDAYGNAVAVVEGGEPSLALAGHADEIGLMVRDLTEDGFLRVTAIGGADRTVSKGQHVRIHTDDGDVGGVVTQTAIHLRDPEDEELEDIGAQLVDIGASDRDEAAALVERGDPVTFRQELTELANGRIAARGLDNRIGIWAAAEGLRRAAASDPTATLYAVSTVQEEVGLQGAKMVGFELGPDAIVATDVTHATDTPTSPSDKTTGVTLGDGPVIARGSANHPALVRAMRDAAQAIDLSTQLQAAGTRSGSDADAFYTARGGIPSLNLGVPNRYMHTPVEVLDLADLDATATLLGAFASGVADADFRVID